VASANDVLVGASDTASLLNLKAAINAAAGGAGTAYGIGTVANVNVNAGTATAQRSSSPQTSMESVTEPTLETPLLRRLELVADTGLYRSHTGWRHRWQHCDRGRTDLHLCSRSGRYCDGE